MRKLYSKRLVGLFLLGGFLISVLGTIILPAQALAAPNIAIKSINYATIEVTLSGNTGGFEEQGGIYSLTEELITEGGVTGGGKYLVFTPKGAQSNNDNCIPSVKIRIGDNGITNSNKGQVTLKEGSNNRCNKIPSTVTVSNLQNGSYTWFNWVDAGRIEPVGFLPYRTGGAVNTIKLTKLSILNKEAANNLFKDGLDCPNFLDKFNGKGSATIHMWSQGGSGGCEDDYKLVENIRIGNPIKADLPAGQGQTTTNGLSSDGSLNTGPGEGADCDASGISLSWIICPINDGLATTSNFIYEKLVVPQLETNVLKLSKTGEKTDGIIDAWASFRNIANVLLVLFILVAIFGQALGGFLDAYAIKKIVPRVLIAAIMINLSLYLMVALEDIFNLLGNGMRDLLLAPFGNSLVIEPGFSSQLFAGAAAAPTAIGLIFAPAATVGLAASALGAILPFFLLFILLPLVLATISVFLTLIIRQGLILFLLLMAPIAFALFVLPNTEKYFKQWWSLLIKALMVFPIIAVFITMGEILGGLTASANPNFIGDIAGLIIKIIPLFLIPFAFKFAGGAIATLSGAISGMANKGGGFIKGNPNLPNSLQNRIKGSTGKKLTDARGLYGAALDNPNSGRFTRRVGRMVGGGAATSESQGYQLKEASDRADAAWSKSDDSYAKASTITPSMMRRFREEGGVLEADGTTTGERYQTRRNDKGQLYEQFAAADGTFFDAGKIAEGRRYYNTAAEKQANFSRLIEKTAPMDEATQDRVFDDWIDTANDLGLDSKTATGRWQGISIPFKSKRADLRRMGISGEKGSLVRGKVNTQGLVTEFADMQQGELVAQGPGTYQNLADGIIEANIPTVPVSEAAAVANQKLRVSATQSFHNLERFVNGAASLDPAVIARMEAERAQAGAEATPGQQQFATSSSAAAKNADAARKAYQKIVNTPGLVDQLRDTYRNINDIT